MRKLLSSAPMQAMLKLSACFLPEGPTDAERAAGFGLLLGEAVNAKGEKMISRLRTLEGYTLTAVTTLEAAKRILGGNAEPGFQTPSRSFGPDFILSFEGCSRIDVQ
jgi:short subunit dehydrogenase-like uncharacterized protein